MICTMDKLKTPLPSAEEGEVGSKREDKTCLKDGEPEGNSEEEEEAEEKTPQAAGQIEDSLHSRDADIPVIETTVRFNLNNEVVKMRKEVKRVRTLIIRKLTRRIGALKKKKGKDTDIERNHRRAMRLLEEIQAMKVLPPDVVTKTALQKNLNLNQVCKNPKSTISDRGLTRIASHPQFIKKIDGIKAALKAFKEGHIQGEGQEAKVKGANKTEKFPPAKERQRTKKKKQEIRKGEITELDTLDSPLKDPKAAAVENPKLGRMKVHHLANTAEDINKEVPEKKTIISVVKDKDTNNVPSPTEKKKTNCNTVSKVLQKKTEEKEESDVELFDNEEKEYFDDSTEERFHRQSSESEESNDDDDFFVGKVSKLKKKIKQNNEGGKREVKVTPSKQEQSELPVAEYKPKAKTAQLQTVFCPTLSVSGRDKSFRRGRGQPGHRETLKGVSQSAFQKQGRGTGYSRSERGGSHQESQLMGSKAWAQGRRDPSRGGANQNHQAKMHLALHPSWEASKKRKEQQGQILAFQGKKIKFDDDD